MKFEKRKIYKTPRLQWGILPATSTSELFLNTTPVLIANDFHNPLTILPKLIKPFPNLHTSITMGENFEGYSDEASHTFDKYTTFRHSSFIEFFEKNSIDVPKCFKLTSSLRRSAFELFFFRFVNYLMKDGKKEKIFIFKRKLKIKKLWPYNIEYND